MTGKRSTLIPREKIVPFPYKPIQPKQFSSKFLETKRLRRTVNLEQWATLPRNAKQIPRIRAKNITLIDFIGERNKKKE